MTSIDASTDMPTEPPTEPPIDKERYQIIFTNTTIECLSPVNPSPNFSFSHVHPEQIAEEAIVAIASQRCERTELRTALRQRLYGEEDDREWDPGLTPQVIRNQHRDAVESDEEAVEDTSSEEEETIVSKTMDGQERSGKEGTVNPTMKMERKYDAPKRVDGGSRSVPQR